MILQATLTIFHRTVINNESEKRAFQPFYTFLLAEIRLSVFALISFLSQTPLRNNRDVLLLMNAFLIATQSQSAVGNGQTCHELTKQLRQSNISMIGPKNKTKQLYDNNMVDSQRPVNKLC